MRQEKLMRFGSFLAALLLGIGCLWFPLPAQAAGDSVGLGISCGVAFPQGSTASISSTNWRASFNWGFYVNIPLIYTFHITPSSELYKFEDRNATDMALAFKFIVPLSRLDLYAGFVPGLTAVTDVIAPHVGVLGGMTFNLIGKSDLFSQAKHKFLFEGDQNLKVSHINAGNLD